ncbi:acyltransferase [Clostridium sp. HBUAS56017]|uniref:acyltransferase family protein n=1 Tax=Clostridium sp. HBUAS56017 TaxID=2571128 RepID=UPI0011783CC1|nr:acyltransferase [Clostridium sp. HBUAS56017]
METKKYYGMIDILRLVFAILVMVIHTMAFSSINEDLRIVTSMGICRIAVPFFFIVSGYFLYNRINLEKEPKSTLKRLLILYGSWVAIEFVALSPGILNYFKYPLSIIMRLLLFGVTGSLWYISSLIITILLISKLLKKDKIIFLLIIGFILYLFGTTGDTYYGLFNNPLINGYTSIFVLPQIGITESILFITLGAAINKYKLNYKIKNAGILSISSIILLLIETFVLNKIGIAKDANMYLSAIIAAPSILIWALNYKKNISNKFSKTCKEYSIGIYCSHQILMLWIQALLPNAATNSMIKFILTFCLSALVITLLRKTKAKIILLE